MIKRKRSIVPVGSTLAVRVSGLLDHLGQPQTDATVQVTALVDKNTGAAHSGVSLPLACNYVADWATRTDRDGRRVFDTDGNYEGLIPHTNGVTADTILYATVVATSAGGLVKTWREETVFVRGES